jgi:hypothetical protein
MTPHRCFVGLAAILLSVAVLASCSTFGSPSASVPLSPTPVPLVSPTPTSASAEPTIAVATAQTGTIYPSTFDPNATPTPVQPSTPFPTAQPAGVASLIYALVDQLGRPDWCDPDFYPIARGDEVTAARAHLDEMKSDEALYQAILDHNGLSAGQQLSDAQLVAVYRDWKVLTKAIVLTPSADGYTFDYIALRGPDGQQTDHHVAGAVSMDGQVSTSVDEPTAAPNCPICLARGMLISTPGGSVPVEQLAVGVIVWTQDESGERIARPIADVGSTPVPATHQVVHLVLADGRTVDVSPGHPLADGRLVGDVRAGDVVDGSTVISADLVAYSGGATFDLLPAGPTGLYWANGILIGSTLGR